jgi:hypothetical protein
MGNSCTGGLVSLMILGIAAMIFTYLGMRYKNLKILFYLLAILSQIFIAIILPIASWTNTMSSIKLCN